LGANLEAGRGDLDLFREDQVVIGLCDPLGAPQAAQELAARGIVLLALELLPRITRAQSMDVLSSLGTIAGYKAVLMAANHLPKMFPMLMTAAGTLTAARVLVVGAGVAGLQAIATARRLGAIVQAYDVRPAVREQVESLGAKFVQMDLETAGAEGAGGYAKALGDEFYRRQSELMARIVAENDVCITTAVVPGQPAPRLVSADAVRAMRPGSVIVDLAAERGGNCELTRADQTTVCHGVTILGPTNLPSEVPQHASQMYSRNVVNFLLHLIRDGNLQLDIEDEIVRETLVTRGGRVIHPRISSLLGRDSAETPLAAAAPRKQEEMPFEKK
jgi:NAD(P) transhydrogenase subunit alpha